MSKDVPEILKEFVSDVDDVDKVERLFCMYQELSCKTAVYDKSRWLEYLTLGLTSEAGEVAGKVKKIIRGDKELDKELALKIFDELSDVCWYVANICNEFSEIYGEDFNYDALHVRNLEKLYDRMNRNVLKGDGDNR